MLIFFAWVLAVASLQPIIARIANSNFVLSIARLLVREVCVKSTTRLSNERVGEIGDQHVVGVVIHTSESHLHRVGCVTAGANALDRRDAIDGEL